MLKFPKSFCEDVGKALNASIERVCRHLLPNGKEQRTPHCWVCGNVQGGEGDSLNVTLSGPHQGSWKDFATNEGGGSIKLWMAATGQADYHLAIKAAAEFLGVPLPERQRAIRSRGREVAAYNYLHLDGTLAHQTVRYEPKDFRQRVPAKEGETRGGKQAREDRSTGKWWIWSLQGTETILYHLPDIAKRTGETVFLCEGEKDCDRLAESGALTTTCPMGAKKWKDSFSQVLAGRKVIVCPDRDAAGMEHLCVVAKRLSGVKCDVLMVDWPALVRTYPDLPAEGKLDVADLICFLPAGTDARQVLEKHAIPVPGTSIDGRPELIVAGDADSEWRDFYRDLGRAVREKNIYRRGSVVLGLNERNQLEPIRVPTFRSWVQDHVALKRWRGRGDEATLAPAQLIKDQAEMVLESPQFHAELRPIRRVHQVPLPVMRLDGTIELLEPGYDEESQILTMPGHNYDREVDEETARKGLLTLVSDFGYDPNDADRCRSVVLGAMLAVFADCLLAAPVQRPVHLFSANTEGGGKTLSVRLAVCPVHGSLQVSPPPRKEGDLQKALLPVAVSGRPYLCLDNWRGRIEDPALEAFITASTYGDRLLGSSRELFVEKQCLVFVTANQAILNGDMRRRSLVCDLFVEEARAEDKKVKTRLDEQAILARRTEILSWLWALVRGWAEEGCPAGSIVHGTFPEWGAMIGGICERQGWVNPVTKPKREMDTNLEDMVRLLTACLESKDNSVRFDDCLTPEELLEAARREGCFEWCVAATAPESGRDQRSERTTFFNQVNKFQGRVLGGIRLTAEGRGHARKYKLERVPIY